MENYQFHNSILPTTNVSTCGWSFKYDHNYYSLIGYINNLFDRYSRLLVIRVDLGFATNTQGQYDAEYGRQCFSRFKNNQRFNSLFANMVGYAWCMEFGVDRGFHYHVLFFYDGARSQQDITIGHAIGRYWYENITGGDGWYHCSNEDKDWLEEQGYPVGIGMIHRNDMAKRDNLIHAATYLLKENPLLRQVLPDSMKGFRIFGRGEITR